MRTSGDFDWESDYDSAHLLALFWNGEFVDLPEVKWHSELRVFTTVQSAVGNSIRECAVLQHRHILFYLRSWNRTVPRYSGGNLLVWGLRLATRLVVPHWVENTDIHLLVLPALLSPVPFKDRWATAQRSTVKWPYWCCKWQKKIRIVVVSAAILLNLRQCCTIMLWTNPQPIAYTALHDEASASSQAAGFLLDQLEGTDSQAPRAIQSNVYRATYVIKHIYSPSANLPVSDKCNFTVSGQYVLLLRCIPPSSSWLAMDIVSLQL